MVTWSIQGHGSLTPCDSDKDKLNRMDGEWMDAECGLQSQKASYLGGGGFETRGNTPEWTRVANCQNIRFFRGANTCW